MKFINKKTKEKVVFLLISLVNERFALKYLHISYFWAKLQKYSYIYLSGKYDRQIYQEKHGI